MIKITYHTASYGLKVLKWRWHEIMSPEIGVGGFVVKGQEDIGIELKPPGEGEVKATVAAGVTDA